MHLTITLSVCCMLAGTGIAVAGNPQLCGIANLPPSDQRNTTPVVTQLQNVVGSEQWTVVLPVVNSNAFSYGKIMLKSGDKFRVTACGCVQTGGKGKSWKLYVNPSGKKSDRLYHGGVEVDLVNGNTLSFSSPVPISSIPVMNLPLSDKAQLHYVRFLDLMPVEQAVPDFWLVAQATETLTLGYEDDHYQDNGYWGHDNGDDNQCEGVGGAAVSVTILRRSP